MELDHGKYLPDLTSGLSCLPEQYFAALLGYQRRGSELLRARVGAERCRPRGDPIEPTLQGGKLRKILRLQLPGNDPRVGRDIGNREILASQVRLR